MPLAVIESQGSRDMNVPMTDYYPLIDTAVAALENNTSAARRTVYEYARSALVRQSRNKIPPLTEAELAGERLALEQAILRVQAEQGRRSSRDASRTHSSDVRPQEPTPERAPPSMRCPQIRLRGLDCSQTHRPRGERHRRAVSRLPLRAASKRCHPAPPHQE